MGKRTKTPEDVVDNDQQKDGNESDKSIEIDEENPGWVS